MHIVFFGSGEIGIPTLKNLREHHQILKVVTQPDRPSGRGRHLAPTPINAAAQELGLQVAAVEDVNDSTVVSELLALGARIGVVVAFGQKIDQAILDGIPAGCINAHTSLLPKYRGAAPIHRAIVNGEEKTGVTVFKLTARMDAGPILTQRWTFIKPEETAEELHDRLGGIAVDAVGAALVLFENDANPPGEPQDETEATPAPKLSKKEGHIDFAVPAEQLARRICGMWSWPGARCVFASADGNRNEEVLLARARAYEGGAANASPGLIDERMLVATAEGMLEILEIKPAGGKLMTWPEFANGRRIRAGDRFERCRS